MIIQIRGTSGSGKSTVMRAVMKKLGQWEPRYVVGRKQPLYYVHDGIAVLGHYGSPCGGCDTIGSARQVFEVTTSLVGFDCILMEGLLLSEDVKWSSQLPDFNVLFLTTPLYKCLDWIRQRRDAAGNQKPLNVANTSNRVATIERARKKLLELGIRCRRTTAEQAPSLILQWLKTS